MLVFPVTFKYMTLGTPQLPPPVALLCVLSIQGTLHLKLINLSLALFIWKYAHWRSGVARRTSLASVRDSTDALETKVITAAARQMRHSLYGTQTDGASKLFLGTIDV